MKNKILKIAVVLALIVIFLIFCIIYFNSYGEIYLKDKEKINSLDDLIYYQSNVDKEIEEYSNSNFTIDNAKIMQNPYKIAPLTAVIIFKTNEEEMVDLSINGKKVTTFDASKKHIIPVYGLKAGFSNIVEISVDDIKKEYVITTEKYEGDDLEVIKNSDSLDSSNYLLSTNFTNNRIYDKNGNLLWYIDGNFAGDIEYVTNDIFYISDEKQGVNGVKINYPTFFKMDYLGKIYTEYVTEYGYHHELLPIDNDTMLVLGSNDNSKFLESEIYVMDLKSGKIKDEFDMYDVLYNIDPEFVKSLGDDFDFVCNSAYYDKEKNELLISSRGLNSVIMLDFNTKSIKWIFGDPTLYTKPFSKYLLSYEGKYPKGQHTAFLYNGLLGIHDNDYDMFNIHQTLGEYKDNYSSSDLYEIDLSTMSIKKVWSYDLQKEEFSKVAGAFKILENGNKLINYGWSINKNNSDNVLINDERYLNGIILELDLNDNELFKAKTKDLTYRVYKVNFYDSKTKNYEIESFTKVSSMKKQNSINTLNLVEKLNKAEDFNLDVKVFVNRISLSYEFDINDSVNIYLVSSGSKTYKYLYKEEKKEAKSSINTYMNSGKYALYIEINGKFYDSKKVINFNN